MGYRKDLNGRVLYKGEGQRKNGKYYYQYLDPNHIRRTINANTLQDLRRKKDTVDYYQKVGIDIYLGERTSLNSIFDKYMSTKISLKESTKTNYLYMYNTYIRPSLGKRMIGKIKYSDVKSFLLSFFLERGFKIRSIEIIHTLLHPVFQLAVRDGLILKNPSDGIMGELKKSYIWEAKPVRALTIPEQKAFIRYIKDSPVFYKWLPLFLVFLGTGGRVGEILGLRWDDVDMVNRIVHINHSIIYRNYGESNIHITTTKTKNGNRDIPMMDDVYEALVLQRYYQEDNNKSCVVDGYTNFIFTNRYGNVYVASLINCAISRIVKAYNTEEVQIAKEEKREAVLLPHFTAHGLRHTFCTRFCEVETNLKVIQEIMGHSDIETTLNVYAEATKEAKKKAITNLSKINILD